MMYLPSSKILNKQRDRSSFFGNKLNVLERQKASFRTFFLFLEA